MIKICIKTTLQDEHPVVEQFRTHYDPVKKVLVTECSEICA